MNKKVLLITLLLLIVSCVPSKDLTYLQGKPVAKKDIERLNNQPYKLQVDDLIHIDLKSVDDKLIELFKKQDVNNNSVSANSNESFIGSSNYFLDYSVDNHGNIRLPYLGEINVLGYTTVEVRKKIESELKKHFKSEDDFFVTVKLSGIKYTIFGEVNSPGPKVIYQNKVSILDAIAFAGDITLVGNRKNVEVLRNSISGTEKFVIDLTNVEAFNSKVFYIQPNDYINVLPLKQKAWGTGTTGLQTLTTVISIFSLITSVIILARNL